MKSSRAPQPIKWKIFFYLCLFAGGLVLMLWLLQVVFLEQFYKAFKTREIRQTADYVAENINSDQLEDSLEQIGTAQGSGIAIVDAQTLLVLESRSASILQRLLETPQELGRLYQLAQSNQGSYTGPLLPWEEGTEAPMPHKKGNDFVPQPLRRGGESIVCLRLTQSAAGPRMVVLVSEITPVNSTVEAIRAELLFISIVVLVAGFCLALLISRKVAAPIVGINQAAKALGQGRFEAPLGPGDYREIAELSQTLSRASKDLGKQEHLRRELLANVSHDLRTPLTMIMGYAEAARDLPGEDTAENLQIIIDEATRLNELVTDLLDLSKLQAQVSPLDLQRFNLTESIRATLDRLSILASSQGLQLLFQQEQEAYVLADSLRLSQVVYNLVGNAMAHAGQGKQVLVRQLVTGQKVRIQVIDKGPGIRPEEQVFIWERYYKNSKTNHRPGSGTGLGLAIAKSVLEQHGADFGVESQLGQGSTFWFELPLAEERDL